VNGASWEALGTTASVYVTARDGLEPARVAVADELDAIDLACSRFRADAELARVNAGGTRAVGPLLAEAIAVALRAAQLSDGIVDPTIGEALILAGYDRDFAQLRPVTGPIKAVRVPGWRAIAFDGERRMVTVPKGVLLDLGATAKALAADRAAAAAAHAANCAVLVNLGGDVAVAGEPPAQGWIVGVGDDHRGPAAQRITIRSGGVATSSTAVRRWGPDRHHIIDPRTGVPAGKHWRTVSVAAATCVDANTASTAAIVLGPSAPRWLEERRLPARLVARDGAVTTVGAWPRERIAA
jgi:thiamine biosynthesis lipoprotein